MDEDGIREIEVRFLLHLPHPRFNRRLVLADAAGDEVVGKGIVTRHQGAWADLVDQHDLVASWIVAEDSDGVPSLHHLPGELVRPAFMFLHLDLIAVELEETVGYRRDGLDRGAELACGHVRWIPCLDA